MDVLARDAEQAGDPVLGPGEALARRVDREPVAVPCRDDGVRLHRIVVLRRRLVGRLDPVRGRGEAGLDIAVPDLRGVPTPTAGGTKGSLPSSPIRTGSAS